MKAEYKISQEHIFCFVFVRIPKVGSHVICTLFNYNVGNHTLGHHGANEQNVVGPTGQPTLGQYKIDVVPTLAQRRSAIWGSI